MYSAAQEITNSLLLLSWTFQNLWIPYKHALLLVQSHNVCDHLRSKLGQVGLSYAVCWHWERIIPQDSSSFGILFTGSLLVPSCWPHFFLLFQRFVDRLGSSLSLAFSKNNTIVVSVSSSHVKYFRAGWVESSWIVHFICCELLPSCGRLCLTI